MMVQSWLKASLTGFLRSRGSEVVPVDALYEWQRDGVRTAGWADDALPPGALEYLRPDHPRLLELQRRYAACDPDVTTPYVWTDRHVRPQDVAHFRGDNAWLYQVRGTNANVLAYALTAYYLQTVDRRRLLETLSEDKLFGNYTFEIGGRLVSRDLLDSVAELYFLDRHVGLDSLTGRRVLDIGAGYGRLAHRATSALPGLDRYLCTDAVAVSTFVSEYYLRYRGAANASVVPLDDVAGVLRERPVDVAINVHSFSECRLEAIAWWARLLRENGVRYLMVVPNADSQSLGERLLTNDGNEFLPVLERFGYRTVAKEPKFGDPVVARYGVHPGWHHLLELT